MSNKNKKGSKKQAGFSSKAFAILIVCGLGYCAFLAKNRGMISFDNTQQLINKFTSSAKNLSSSKSKVSASEYEKTSNINSYSGYGVQLVATQELKQAKFIMNDFARDGYSAFVLASKAKKETVYKVRLGPYAYKPEAVAVQANVIRRYPKNPYVKDSLVVYKPN